METLFSTRDTRGYGILDAADKRGHKNAYIDYLQKRALEQAGVFKTTDVVLDLGCGVGRMSAWLASRVLQVYGIDVGTALLQLAATYNAHGNISYKSYDGRTLPFPDAFFDAILSIGVLQKRVFPAEQLPHILSECDRVLKASGTIVTIEHVYRRPHVWSYAREELLAYFARQGFTCTACYPLRKGRWPVLYLIRLGLIPPSLHARLARYELAKRRHEHEAYFDYKDYLFRFEKKGSRVVS